MRHIAVEKLIGKITIVNDDGHGLIVEIGDDVDRTPYVPIFPHLTALNEFKERYEMEGRMQIITKEDLDYLTEAEGIILIEDDGSFPGNHHTRIKKFKGAK